MPVTEAVRATAMEAVLFSSIPADLADRLLERASVRHFTRGQTIFIQSEPATAIYVVISGWAKLYRISPAGSEAVVGVFTRGRSFGEAAAFQGDVYPVSAEAVTDCTLLELRAGLMLEMMQHRPELCMAMLGATFRHLHALVAQIEQLKAQNGAQRVAEFLASLCPPDAESCTVTLPYDKSLIAGRLGMKPESLSRAFARLRAHGVVISQNHAAIADVEALRALSDEDPAASWRSAD